jgi:RNA polymerase sigma-70 factor (ECF subfamily)
VQAEDFHDSVRPGLVAMLPRLKRFADLLAGNAAQGTDLLRRALLRMLTEQHLYQRGTALDRFAFTEIYREWLKELREHPHPIALDEEDADFARLFGETAESDPEIVAFLRVLSPPQRLTLLLVYGERFDHIDAARVLDAAPDTVAARLVRITASLADHLAANAAALPEAVYGEPA